MPIWAPKVLCESSRHHGPKKQTSDNQHYGLSDYDDDDDDEEDDDDDDDDDGGGGVSADDCEEKMFSIQGWPLLFFSEPIIRERCEEEPLEILKNSHCCIGRRREKLLRDTNHDTIGKNQVGDDVHDDGVNEDGDY